MSYHNGSVWPHDSALIAAGLARYGFKREAMRIFRGLFAASTYVDLRRLPELFLWLRAAGYGGGPLSILSPALRKPGPPPHRFTFCNPVSAWASTPRGRISLSRIRGYRISSARSRFETLPLLMGRLLM
jgi:glycogen debranching enzyme